LHRVAVSLVVAIALLVSGASSDFAAQTPQTGFRVLSAEGTRALPTVAHNNQERVALDDLVQLFKLTLREDRLAGGVTVTAGSRSIILTPDQPVVSVAGRLVSLSAPPIRQGNRWLLPLDFLSRALGPALDTRIDVRRAGRFVVIGDLRVPRVMARVDTTPGSATVSFDTTPSTPARVVVETGRLLVSFEADALELALPSVAPGEFLLSMQPGDTPNTVRINTAPRFAMHRATTSQPEPGSSRLVVELLPSGTEAPAPSAPTPSPAPVDPLPLPLPMPTPGVRTVVIDPGHGGDEIGARGTNGAQEKDVTLAVARRLKALIESRLGLRVFLTREDDRTMTLDERSAYANSQKADVFVSIHANAALSPTMRGAEVYYLSMDASDAEARRLAESSGTVLPALGGGTRAIDLIPWDTAQARYLDLSSTLAGLIHQALASRVPMSPRAMHQAPFRVLVGANMPAVLVEMGYLSHPEQERALTSTAYQDQVAQALFDALSQFRTQVERPSPPAPATSAPRPPRS
jgi:N-acetylmuramoyl-L-alanine amidase